MNAHAGNVMTISYPPHWEDPRPARLDRVERHRTHRACSFCGSMHPEDLAAAIANGAILHWAAFKFGAPYRAYITNLPNPFVGMPEVVASTVERGQLSLGRKIPSPARVFAEFVVEHLKDATPEQKDVIERAMRYRFYFSDDGRMQWGPL